MKSIIIGLLMIVASGIGMWFSDTIPDYHSNFRVFILICSVFSSMAGLIAIISGFAYGDDS